MVRNELPRAGVDVSTAATGVTTAPEGPGRHASERPASGAAGAAPPPPSTRGYWVGGGTAAVSLVAAAAVGLLGVVVMTHRIDDFQRVDVGGSGVVRFADTGGYTVYYEAPGISAGRSVPALRVALAPSSGGEAVPLFAYRTSFEYHVPGRAGRAVLTFRIVRPGPYRLVATGPAGTEGTLAVGRSAARAIAVPVATAAAVGVLGFGAGIAVILATARRRRAHAARSGGTP